jgi:hypothetical protein
VKTPIFLFWGIMLAVAMVFTATPAMAESVSSVPATLAQTAEQQQAPSWYWALTLAQAAEESEQAVEEPEQAVEEPEQAAEESEQAAEEEEQAAEPSRPLRSWSRPLNRRLPSNVRLTSIRAVTPTPSTPVVMMLFR